MSLLRWWHARSVRRHTSLISQLQSANRQLRAARLELAEVCGNHSSDARGRQDTDDARRWVEVRITYWSREQRKVARKLGMNQVKAREFI